MTDATATPSKSLVEKMIEPSDQLEKAWWQSKKFFAFIMAELGFFALMATMLLKQEMNKLGENVAFMVLAVTAGVLASFYLGGQALVDRYVRVAAILVGKTLPKEGNG